MAVTVTDSPVFERNLAKWAPIPNGSRVEVVLSEDTSDEEEWYRNARYDNRYDGAQVIVKISDFLYYREGDPYKDPRSFTGYSRWNRDFTVLDRLTPREVFDGLRQGATFVLRTDGAADVHAVKTHTDTWYSYTTQTMNRASALPATGTVTKENA